MKSFEPCDRLEDVLNCIAFAKANDDLKVEKGQLKGLSRWLVFMDLWLLLNIFQGLDETIKVLVGSSCFYLLFKPHTDILFIILQTFGQLVITLLAVVA